MTSSHKTLAVKPEDIPSNLIPQLVLLFNDHLHAGFTADDVIPYFTKRYDKFIMLVSEDEMSVFACVGVNLLQVDDCQMLYIGALVSHPDYRKFLLNSLYKTLALQLMQYRLVQPFQKMFVVGALVSPVPYAMIAKYVPTVIPSPLHPELPDELKPIVSKTLLQLYPDSTVDEHVKVMEPSRSFEASIQIREDAINPRIAYYLEQNPAYKRGVGLIFCIPLSLDTMKCILTALFKTDKRLAA